MDKLLFSQRFFIIAFLLLSGCGNSPDVYITELHNNTVSYDETIHINNCGGKADSEQIASRSFATTIGGELGFSAGYQSIIEGSVAAKYSQYRDVTKSQKLIAPPGTNMEFVLRWSEEIHAGNVTVNGKVGNYEVRVPIAVEQVLVQDLGCSGTSSSSSGDSNPIIQSLPETPIATETPVVESTPTDTPLGTVLTVGQSWRQDGLVLTLSSATLSEGNYFYGVGPGIKICFVLTNQRSYDFSIRYSNENFKVRDNRGRQVSFLACTDDTACREWHEVNRVIHVGESVSFGLMKTNIIRSDFDCTYIEVDTSDTSLTALYISIVNVSSIVEATWVIPVYH